MKISSAEARKLLLDEFQKTGEKDDSWVRHSFCVGETAGKIAEALNARVKELAKTYENLDLYDQVFSEANFGDEAAEEILRKFCNLVQVPLDTDQVKALGFLHDIGKIYRPYNAHLINGYNFMNQLGLDPEYGNISLTHSFFSNDPDRMLAPFRDKFQTQIRDFILHHEFSLAERIINLCDNICECEVWTLEKRMIDIMSRHGSSERSQEYIILARERKAEFDLMLGRNLYDLFPEIKENL